MVEMPLIRRLNVSSNNCLIPNEQGCTRALQVVLNGHCMCSVFL